MQHSTYPFCWHFKGIWIWTKWDVCRTPRLSIQPAISTSWHILCAEILQRSHTWPVDGKFSCSFWTIARTLSCICSTTNTKSLSIYEFNVRASCTATLPHLFSTIWSQWPETLCFWRAVEETFWQCQFGKSAEFMGYRRKRTSSFGSSICPGWYVIVLVLKHIEYVIIASFRRNHSVFLRQNH